MLTRLDYLRLLAASFAVAISLVICFMRGHVHVNVSDPETYLNPLRHRCGVLLIGSLVWLFVEMGRLATSSAAFGPVRSNRS